MLRPLLVLSASLLIACASAPPAPTADDLWSEARWRSDSSGLASLSAVSSEGLRPLSMTRLEVRVQIRGRLARTEVTQVFQNNQPTPAEGIYTFQLPPDATIRRLAMDVEGVMTEGEVVERHKARQIYDGIVNRRRDPALLEWSGEGRFTTHIFPIPGRGTKTVIVTYEEVLPETLQGRFYRYQLPRWDDASERTAIHHFTLEVDAGEDSSALATLGYTATRGPEGALRVEVDDFIPSGPFDLRLPPTREPRVHSHDLGGVRFVAAELPLGLTELPSIPAPEHLVVALDTSASTLPQTLLQARHLIDALGQRHRLSLVQGDLKAHRCDAPRPATCQEGLRPGGATHLPRLLDAAARAGEELDGSFHVVLLSDGRSTWPLRPRGPDDARLHALAIGPAPDIDALERLTSPTGGHVLRVPPGAPHDEVADALLQRLEWPRIRDVRAEVTRGDLELTTTPTSLALGESLVIAGRGRDAEEIAIAVEALVGERAIRRTFTVDVPESGPALGPAYLWAQRELQRLLDARQPRDAIVDFSIKHGVMSPYTSLLVLENEAMYADNAIERRKRAEHARNVDAGADRATSDGAAPFSPIETAASDRDGDGLIDTIDRCPDEPEVVNGVDDEDGCPESSRVRVMSQRLRIVERVYFAEGDARVPARSEPLLDDVAEVLFRNPDLSLLAVEGHADAAEGDRAEALALERAEVVLEALVSRGVERERLLLAGFAANRPITRGDTEDERAHNRRVEWRILARRGKRFAYVSPKDELNHIEGLASPTLGQRARRFELLLGLEREEEAMLAFDAAHEALEGDELLAYLHRLREHTFEPYEALALEQLEAGTLDDRERHQLALAAIEQRDKALFKRLLDHPPEPPELRTSVLTQLTRVNAHEQADTLFRAWFEDLSPAERFTTLYTVGLAKRSAELRLEVAHAVLADHPPRALLNSPEVLIAASRELGREGEAATLLLERCEAGLSSAEDCAEWLKSTSKSPLEPALMERVEVARLEHLRALRRIDPSDTAPILEAAHLLEARGAPDAALRVLSELVEHHPERRSRWERYAEALTERGLEAEAKEARIRASVAQRP